MSVFKHFRKLSYHPFIVKVFQFLHVRSLMRKLYYVVAQPKSGIKKISFDGIEAQFHIHNPMELRIIETPFEKGLGDERALLLHVLQKLHNGGVVFDIGASLGVHTVFMAKKVGKQGQVISFEPEDTSFSSLEENIQLNSLQNVELIKTALGNDFSEGWISSEGGTADFSMLRKEKDRASSKVSIVPGDFLVQQKKIAVPKVMKIDVEGYEYYVMQGLEKTLKNKKCEMVCCEIHPLLLPNGITAHDVIDLLKEFGFDCRESSHRGETIHAFFYKN